MSNREEVDEVVSFEAASPQSRVNSLYLAWRHRWLLVLGAVIGCIGGALYYARATPIYESTAQILVVNKSREFAPVSSSGNEAESSTMERDYLSTHQTLIRSPVIVGNAVQQAELAALPSFARAENPTGAIIHSLKLSQELNNGKPTNVLNVSFRSSNPKDTFAVVTAVTESYQRFLKDRYQNAADEASKLITDANDLLEKKLATKQKEYDEFIAQNHNLWRGPTSLSPVQERIFALEAKQSALLMQEADILGRLAAIDKALKEGNYSRAELLAMSAVTQMSMMSQTSQMSPTSGGSGGSRGGGNGGNGGSGSKDTTVVALTMEERLMALEVQEKTLAEDYGRDHPLVRAVHDQLALLQMKVKRSGKEPENDDGTNVVPMKTHIQALKLELENTRMVEESLRKLLSEEVQKARPLRALERRDELYRMEIGRSQQLFEALAKRLDEISILKNVTTGYEAQVISPPDVGVKVAPRALFVLPPSLLLGLLAGFCLAYLAEISDQSFRTPEEIRRRLGLPVVGHIPLFTPEDNEKLAPADGPQVDPILCTVYRPKSREAEAYRGVRTALLFNQEGGHSLIQVTSPDMGDGKSTLIANLAVSLAQAEKKVILIDADFRRPRIHKLFNIHAEQGLASVISGEAELNDVIQDSPIPGLAVVPAGPIPPNPAELLSVPRFKELLAYIREKYDFVLIDTPPLLAVTDPCAVVPHVDGVLLAVRISKNARPHASRAKEILSTLGARVIGVVVNGTVSDSKGYGYDGYGYGYGYRYYNYRYYDYSGYESDASSSTDAGERESTLVGGATETPKKRRSASRHSSRKKSGFFTWLFDR